MGIPKKSNLLRDFSKKSVCMVSVLLLLVVSIFSSCGKDDVITLITREDGSGTRSAFASLVGLENEDGSDSISTEAEVTNNTAVMISSITSNESAIGYISLGSLDDTVKALKINGVEASAANVSNNSYPIKRPFNIAYQKSKLTKLGSDYISFIQSKEGQKIIEENGYIPNKTTKSYKTNPALKGKLKVGGSSSVSPVMEKLKEAYQDLNKGVTVEIQTTDSSTGLKDAIAGVAEIGMASRDLKPEESAVLTSETICLDGIAVIVNKENDLDNLTMDQVKDIFKGLIKSFKEVK